MKLSSPVYSQFESIFSRFVHADCLQFYWQQYPAYSLIYVAKGCGRRFVGDHISLFSKGDCVLIPPHMPFAFVSDPLLSEESLDYMWISLPKALFEEHLMKIPEMSSVCGLLQRSARALSFDSLPEALSGVLMDIPQMQGMTHFLSCISVFDSLVSVSPEVLASRSWDGALTQSDHERIQLIGSIINKRYTENVTGECIAAELNISSSAFSRLFKRLLNKKFQTFLTEIRIFTAAYLLEKTDLLVEDVGKASGFGTLAGFSKRFKEYSDTSPAAYRRQRAG